MDNSQDDDFQKMWNSNTFQRQGSSGFTRSVGRARPLHAPPELDPGYQEPLNTEPPAPIVQGDHDNGLSMTTPSNPPVTTLSPEAAGISSNASSKATSGEGASADANKSEASTTSEATATISTPGEDCTISTAADGIGISAQGYAGQGNPVESCELGPCFEKKLPLSPPLAPEAPLVPVARQGSFLRHLRVLVDFGVISKITENSGRLQQELTGHAVSGGRVFVSFNDNVYASDGKFLRPLNFVEFISEVELRCSLTYFVRNAVSKDCKSFSLVLFRRYVDHVMVPLRASGILFFFGIRCSNFKVIRRSFIGTDNVDFIPNQPYINEQTGMIEQEVICTLNANTIDSLVNFLAYLGTKIALYKQDAVIPQNVWPFFEKKKDLPHILRNVLPIHLVPQEQDII